MGNKKESIEERCIDEEGVPKYRKISLQSSYCLASQFKGSKDPKETFETAENVKNGLKCPYFGTLIFDLGENDYALNCTNEEKEEGRL